MKKADSLRAALTAALPYLQQTPEALDVFIDKGSIASTGRPGTPETPLAFEYRFRLNLLLTDFAGDADVVFATLIVWLTVHQRQLLDRYVAGDREAVRFEVDVLADDKVDLSIELDLSEKVTAAPKEGGGFTFTHLAEAGLGDPDDYPGAPLASVQLGDDFILGNE